MDCFIYAHPPSDRSLELDAPGRKDLPSFVRVASAMTDFARGRPVRMAFLIADGPDANEMLDAAFAYSQGVWGGRFALMVPCSNGTISDAFWAFLELHDPDVVYSFAPLSEALRAQIHERIYPSKLIEHRGTGRGTAKPPFRVELGFTPLPTISMLPFVRICVRYCLSSFAATTALRQATQRPCASSFLFHWMDRNWNGCARCLSRRIDRAHASASGLNH